MQRPLTRLVILVAIPVATGMPASSLYAADASGELVLSPEYLVERSSDMPAPAQVPGLRFEPHDYDDYSATEWQAVLRGEPEPPTALCEQLRSADFVVTFPRESAVTVHWSQGSHAEPGDFRPRTAPLEPGGDFSAGSFGGRSSDGAMPYFNLAADGGGLVVAVGWSGDWKASFTALGGGRVRVRAGLARSRFRLRPDEELRLPSVLVMPYAGDRLAGQNRFRRLLLGHFTPKGRPPLELMPVAASVHGMLAFNDTTEANLTAIARDVAATKLPLDTFWLDAGWNEGGFPGGQGNPAADPVRFPRGLAPVGEAARDAGLRFLAWFEPERAMRGTRIDREHPEWLLAPSGTPAPLRYHETDGFRLLDLGDADARAWAVDVVSSQVRDAGVSIYRQDANLYPAYFWHTGEGPEEVGLREVRYVNGLYAFLDELARRHDGLILDNCASGGRRLDFEMTRRCICLWRSDNCWDDRAAAPRNMQAMTHGLSHWLPLHGLGAAAADPVSLRSGMGACASYAVNFRDPAAVEALRGHLDRYLAVRRLFTADYYPLTAWADDPAAWLAFQFHDPVADEGLVQAFRGPAGSSDAVRLRLGGLRRDGRYRIDDWDRVSDPTERTGAELADEGIRISPRGDGQQAVVLHYRSADVGPAGEGRRLPDGP